MHVHSLTLAVDSFVALPRSGAPEPLGGRVFLEEVGDWEQVLEFYRPPPFLVSSLLPAPDLVSSVPQRTITPRA